MAPRHVSRAMLWLALLACTGLARAAEPLPIESDGRDWPGIRRDLVYLVGWQVVATAIIYNAPFEFSNWSQDEKDQLGWKQWGRNVTHPVWDEDHWGVNYLLHPYWGAGYYIRGRERGFSRRESVWVAVVFSSFYEFGIESFLEEPSIQDLIVTPLAGAALGLYFEGVRDRIRAREGRRSFGDRLVLGLTDPLGALNRGVDRVLGIGPYDRRSAEAGLRLLRPQGAASGAGVDGVQLVWSYRW